jgi:hypothetical protein
MTDADYEQNVAPAALEALRNWTSGLLRCDDIVHPIKYVIAPDGRLVTPVTKDMLEAVDCALIIPDDDSPTIELAVTLEPFDRIGGAESNSDRWRIYHGDPPHNRWALIELDMARFDGCILDGSAVQQPNQLAAVEPRICGLLNREHLTNLHQAVQTMLQLDLEDPRVVGLDPTGLHVRARFDIVRLPFEVSIDSPANAEQSVLDFICQ